MPHPSLSTFSRIKALRLQTLVTNILTIINEINGIDQLKRQGSVDFGTIDFSVDAQIGYLNPSDFDNAISEILTMQGNIPTAVKVSK